LGVLFGLEAYLKWYRALVYLLASSRTKLWVQTSVVWGGGGGNHTYNPRYLGSRDQKDGGLRLAQAKKVYKTPSQ
jgi:hypothetical protein